MGPSHADETGTDVTPTPRASGRMGSWRSRVGDRRQATSGRRSLRDRGATAVETALMAPLLFFLFFGIVEFGLYWQADHTINEASRAGARLGATLARELNYDLDVVEAVERAIADNIPSGEPQYLTIYRADPATGDPISGTVLNCTVNCYRYTWDSINEEFSVVSGPEWAAADQAACGESGHNDYMGVFVQATARSVTGLFGNDRTVKESSVIRLEPVPLSSTCEP